jgi:carbonic anhydrase/acetyltransferase-like protein (isoleucine patch superfamily)
MREKKVSVGEKVTVGHGAIIHGCEIGDCSLIGMGAVLLNGCKIGKNCLIGAGTPVPGGCGLLTTSTLMFNVVKLTYLMHPEIE